jgi:hypothetical protein
VASLPSIGGDLAAGLKLLGALPGILHRPFSLGQAKGLVESRLARREQAFLELVGRLAEPNGPQPYPWLFRQAGCEVGDVARVARASGVEVAARTLLAAGVYLEQDELKGRRPIRRGSAELAPVAYAPRRSAGLRLLGTGGSSGSAVSYALAPAFERELAADVQLYLAARGCRDWVHALWEGPGSAAVRHLVWLSQAGGRPSAWFSQVSLRSPALHPRYRASARLLRLGSLALGAPLPVPRYVAVETPLPLARWLAAQRAAGRVPHVWTYVTSAVRICQAGRAAGLDLHGVEFTANGEPVTAARVAEIERVGARLGPYYGSLETGPQGYGCLAPAEPDDVHLAEDACVLLCLARDEAPPGLPAGALLVSSLLPTTALPLLNASLGDQGVLSDRACGCPLERLGWRTHLSAVRSFRRVTAGGMTFDDAAIGEVLEQDLAPAFGGGPLDYQLVEVEAGGAGPAALLLVHPRLGPLDDGALEVAFRRALARRSSAYVAMVEQWRQAGLPLVERRAPYSTATGKTLIVHRLRPSVG